MTHLYLYTNSEHGVTLGGAGWAFGRSPNYDWNVPPSRRRRPAGLCTGGARTKRRRRRQCTGTARTTRARRGAPSKYNGLNKTVLCMAFVMRVTFWQFIF